VLTSSEKKAWLEELSNLDGRVLLKCEIHNFFPGNPKSRGTLGCRECAMAELFHQLATAPPHKREELLELMERGINSACEADARGEWDFKMYERPVISYERDVN
jgi:hypothetical protein